MKGGRSMAEPETKVRAKTEEKPIERPTALQAWRPCESLGRQIDRIFENFDQDPWRLPCRRSIFDVEPFWRRELAWGPSPTVDIVEKNDAYEVTAELPGMDERSIEVKLANGGVMSRGEEQEEKEEKTQDSHLHERRFGPVARRFAVPERVHTRTLVASLKNGIIPVRRP